MENIVVTVQTALFWPHGFAVGVTQDTLQRRYVYSEGLNKNHVGLMLRFSWIFFCDQYDVVDKWQKKQGWGRAETRNVFHWARLRKANLKNSGEHFQDALSLKKLLKYLRFSDLLSDKMSIYVFCAFILQGDLWAESSFLGYKLHFYACMEGEVFDVTEWAACQVWLCRCAIQFHSFNTSFVISFDDHFLGFFFFIFRVSAVIVLNLTLIQSTWSSRPVIHALVALVPGQTHSVHCFLSSLRFALLFFPLVFGMLLFVLQITEKRENNSIFLIADRRREILRISCAHFSDSFRRTGKDFKEQASHRRDEGRKSIERWREKTRRKMNGLPPHSNAVWFVKLWKGNLNWSWSVKVLYHWS